MSSPAPFVNNDAPLARIPARDLVVLCFIVKPGISRLRWPVPGDDDLGALRHELLRRETAVAA